MSPPSTLPTPPGLWVCSNWPHGKLQCIKPLSHQDIWLVLLDQLLRCWICWTGWVLWVMGRSVQGSGLHSSFLCRWVYWGCELEPSAEHLLSSEHDDHQQQPWNSNTCISFGTKSWCKIKKKTSNSKWYFTSIYVLLIPDFPVNGLKNCMACFTHKFLGFTLMAILTQDKLSWNCNYHEF